MLKDLDISKIPIKLGGKDLYLRFNLNSTRYLEHYGLQGVLQKDSTDWEMDDAIHLLRAGLMDCYFDDNETAISSREFEKVIPSIATIGRLIDETSLQEIGYTIIQAIIDSIPTKPVGANPHKGGRK